jgi:hypothetical protein
MCNLIEQYSQPEDRLAHAVLSSLAADPKLFQDFICWAIEPECGLRIDAGGRGK